MKNSALVAYPVHEVVLNFTKKYKTWLMQKGRSLMAFLRVETEMNEGLADADTGGIQKSVCGYWKSQILDAEKSFQVTLRSCTRERKVHILHWCMHMVQHNMELSCTAGIGTRTNSNVELNLVSILKSYCCDIFTGKDISGFRHSVSERRTCARGLSIIKDKRKEMFMKEISVTNTCQARKAREVVMNLLAYSGSDVTIEERRKVKSLSKDALMQMSLLEWPFINRVYSQFKRMYHLLHTLYLSLSCFTTLDRVYLSF